MLKIYSLSRCFLLVLLLIQGITSALPVQPKKPWLFFTYLAGDNSLSDFIQQNLDQMIKSYSENVHIVVFLSTKNDTDGKFSKKLYVTKNGIGQDGDLLPNLDSGSVDTAVMATSWALQTFPADKIVLNFWDHGSGILNPRNKPTHLRGVCFDDSTGNYLTDLDLIHILQAANKLTHRTLDIVSFDACLMAGVEVAETLRLYANYLVASEETVGALGFQYAFILSALKTANITPLELALCMVKDYDLLYHTQSYDYTLSATNLKNIAALTLLLNQLADMLTQFIKNDTHTVVTKVLQKIAFGPRALRFEQADYVDLANFLNLLNGQIMNLRLTWAQRLKLQQLIRKLLIQVQSVVVSKVSSPRFNSCGGLSIYLPKTVDISYADLYWSTQSRWFSFLKTLMA